MNQEIAKYNQFDRFLGYEMTDEEEDQFQQKLDSDHDLQREFEEYKALIGSFKELEKEQFRNQLIKRGNDIISQERQNEEDAANDNKVKSLWNRKKLLSMAAAAACIVILLLPASIYIYTSTIKPDQLYNKYYSPYQNVVAPSVRGEEKKSAIQQSLSSYTAKNYEKAITDIRKVINEYPGLKSDVSLYLGISYLETDKTKKAIATFQDIIQNEEQFEDQARWFLAMSYLKRGETAKAKNKLKVLADDPDSSYQDKAQEVMTQL